MTSNVVPLASRPRVAPSGSGGPRAVRAGEPRAVYSVPEVARLLSLSLGSTYALLREGEIPARKLGNRWVIPKKRFHAWLDECADPAEDGQEGWA